MDIQPVLPPEARCIDCKYALRGLHENRCPECGRAFDPADRSTFLCGPTMGSWRSLAKPPSIWECAVASVLSVLLIAGAGVFPINGSMLATISHFACFFGGGIILLIFVVRFVSTVYDQKRRRLAKSPIANVSRIRWCFVPSLLFVVASIAIYPWPLWIRFKMSQSALEAAVEDCLAGKLTFPRDIGFFHVKSAGVNRMWEKPVVQFVCDDWDGQCGFQYSGNNAFPDWDRESGNLAISANWRTFGD